MKNIVKIMLAILYLANCTNVLADGFPDPSATFTINGALTAQIMKMTQAGPMLFPYIPTAGTYTTTMSMPLVVTNSGTSLASIVAGTNPVMAQQGQYPPNPMANPTVVSAGTEFNISAGTAYTIFCTR